jgi:2-amino-4-hydroxy-6-hydroxymethyldihydropteridine diphosphokinase
MNTLLLSLGSNLGDRYENIIQAVASLHQDIGEIIRISSIYETAAWGLQDQPAFLNMVVEIHTQYSPTEVLNKINIIEKRIGRIRYEKWGSRIIDIDILFYNDIVIKQEQLTIPHQNMANRRFVLEPLAEIAEGFIHPVLHESIGKLLQNCEDQLEVKVYQVEKEAAIEVDSPDFSH